MRPRSGGRAPSRGMWSVAWGRLASGSTPAPHAERRSPLATSRPHDGQVMAGREPEAVMFAPLMMKSCRARVGEIARTQAREGALREGMSRTRNFSREQSPPATPGTVRANERSVCKLCYFLVPMRVGLRMFKGCRARDSLVGPRREKDLEGNEYPRGCVFAYAAERWDVLSDAVAGGKTHHSQIKPRSGGRPEDRTPGLE